jgi:hypothetical protein
MKDGDDITQLLKMPATYMLSILREDNQNMSQEDEERVLDRFLDTI